MYVMNISDEEIKKCNNLTEVCRLFNLSINGRGFKLLKEILNERNIDYNYFKNKKIKYCLECGKKIENKNKKRKFCSSSCAATYNNKKRKHTNKTIEKISNSLHKYYNSEMTINVNEYFIKKRKCKECGKEFEIKRKKNERFNNNVFCSIECREKNKLYDYYRIKNDNSDNIISKNKKCKECGKEFTIYKKKGEYFSKTKFCSNDCRKKSKSKKLSDAIQKRIKNGTHKGWINRKIISFPEQFFINVLENNNLENKYEFNYSINKRKDLNIDEPYNYFLDFYFKEKKICLEIDGKQHNYRKEYDKLRDERLENVGIKVYRIKWKNINNENGKNYIKKEIQKFLDFYNNIN